MEKHESSFVSIFKFSHLCKILPYYGHLPEWREMLVNLCTETKRIWIEYESAFTECAKEVPMNYMKLLDSFDEKYKQYLEDSKSFLSYKLIISLGYQKNQIDIFENFCKNCMKKRITPIFYSIKVPLSICTSYFTESLYNTLKLMGDNKHNLLVEGCLIKSSKYEHQDFFTKTGIDNVIDTEYYKNLQILVSITTTNRTYYLYSQFNIEKFGVSDICIKLDNDEVITFFDAMAQSEDLQNQMKQITSVYYNCNYYSALLDINKKNSLYQFFPNLKSLRVIYSFSFTVEILKVIRDNELDILVNSSCQSESRYSMLNINYSFIDYDFSSPVNQLRTQKQYMAYKKEADSDFEYYLFESAIIDSQNEEDFITVDGRYAIFCKNENANFNKIKMMKNLSNEEIKSAEQYEDLVAIKAFVKEHENKFEYNVLIIDIGNFSQVRANIYQSFDSNLMKAKLFEFYLYQNLMQEYQSKRTLLEAIPDYISLGYDKENTKMKTKGFPVSLIVKIKDITKETLSIFSALKSKNVYKIALSIEVKSDQEGGSEIYHTLFNYIKSFETVKQIRITIYNSSNKYSSKIYTFRGLDKSRLDQIIDTLNSTPLTSTSQIPNLNSFKQQSDIISIYSC